MIKDIQYSDLLDKYVTKNYFGINFLKSGIRKIPPKLKNDAIIFLANSSKGKIIKEVNKYMSKEEIHLKIVDMELNKWKE